MKKSLLTIAFAMVAMVSSAQFYVGGSLGLKLANDKVNDSYFSLSPEVGYTLNENLSFGAILSLDIEWSEYNSNGTSWELTPYARYTFLRSGKFSCFADGQISLGAAYNDFAFGIYVSPGVAFDVTENVTLISHIGVLGWDNNYYGLDGFALGVDASIFSMGIHYTF